MLKFQISFSLFGVIQGHLLTTPKLKVLENSLTSEL